MNLDDVTTALDRLRLGRVHGSPSAHQPVALIWAGMRAVKGEPRLARWREARSEVTAAIAAIAGSNETDVAAYPVLALKKSPLWDLEASDQAPAGHSSAAARWLNDKNPYLGLSSGVYDFLTEGTAFE